MYMLLIVSLNINWCQLYVHTGDTVSTGVTWSHLYVHTGDTVSPVSPLHNYVEFTFETKSWGQQGRTK